MAGGAEGKITAVVWPAHVGFAVDDSEMVPAERRSQIYWRVEGGQIVGEARCWVPKGTYSCVKYFRAPDGPHCGVAPFGHPYVQPQDDWVVVDPIKNEDPILASPSGVAR